MSDRPVAIAQILQTHNLSGGRFETRVLVENPRIYVGCELLAGPITSTTPPLYCPTTLLSHILAYHWYKNSHEDGGANRPDGYPYFYTPPPSYPTLR